MESFPLSKESLSQLLISDCSPLELFNTLSEYEYWACLHGDSMDQELIGLFYAAYFFSHLLLDQTCEARMLIKRIPQSLLDATPSLRSCLILLRAVWQRRYESVYKILRESLWSDQLSQLVRGYNDYFQRKTLAEVSKAYESIRPATAATYLGIDITASEQCSPSTIKRFIAHGWAWNDQESLLHPKLTVVETDNSFNISKKLSEVTALVGNVGC